MTNVIKNAVAISLLPVALLSGCGGGSSDSGNGDTSAAAVSVAQAVNTPTPVVGDRVTWTISAVNNGKAATTGVITLVSSVPANVGSISTLGNISTPASISARAAISILDSTSTPQQSGGPTCGPAISGGTVTCTIPPGLAPGATATIVLTGTATAAGSINIAVTPSGAGVTGCAKASDCSSTTTVSVAPNVTVSTTVDKTAAVVNNTINWTITAKNTGGVTSAPITLTDTLPSSGISAASITSTTLNGVSVANYCSVSGSAVTCTVPAGLAATTGTATAVISATATAAVTLGTTVSGAPCTPSLTCTTSTTVSAAPTPNVTVSSAVDKTTATAGDTLNWTITAKNSGTGDTTSVTTLTDTLPSAGIGSVTPGSTTGGMSCSVSGSTVTCTVPAVASGGGLTANGGTASAVISAPTTAPGTLQNTVSTSTYPCTSGSVCTNSTTVNPAGGPQKVSGSCGNMIDTNTMNTTFGGSTGTMVLGLGFLGNTNQTANGGTNTSTYLVGLYSGDAASVESYPPSLPPASLPSTAPYSPAPGPGSGTMIAATGSQFICASVNGDGSTTGASGYVKYSSDIATAGDTANVGYFSINQWKGAGGKGFITFNLPSLSDFSMQFVETGTRTISIDYTTDGTNWLPMGGAGKGTLTLSSGTKPQNNLMTTGALPNAPITTPLVLRVSNGTGGTVSIDGLMLKP